MTQFTISFQWISVMLIIGAIALTLWSAISVMNLIPVYKFRAIVVRSLIAFSFILFSIIILVNH